MSNSGPSVGYEAFQVMDDHTEIETFILAADQEEAERRYRDIVRPHVTYEIKSRGAAFRTDVTFTIDAESWENAVRFVERFLERNSMGDGYQGLDWTATTAGEEIGPEGADESEGEMQTFNVPIVIWHATEGALDRAKAFLGGAVGA